MRSNSPITIDQIRVTAPAVLTTEKGPNMFDVYQHVSSWNVIEALLDSGYGISRAQQIDGKHTPTRLKKFSKHIVRPRPPEAFKELVAGEHIPEIVYTASHDGSSAIHMKLGMFRVICSNGMMTGAGDWANARILHKVGAEESAITAAKQLIERSSVLNERIDRMKQVELDREQALRFAAQALPLRFDNPQNYDPGVLLMLRRLEDAQNSVWHVLNRVQENIMKGGFESAPGPKGRVVRLGEVTRISADVSINSALWDMAESLVA
jgi:uncharacterized small protein (DUF1192 family)